MKITKISQQRKNSERYNIFIDGVYSFSLSQNQLLEEKLAIGDVLEIEKLKKLKDISQQSLFYDKAINFLGFRPRSKKEVSDYLKRYAFRKKIEKEKVLKIVSFVIEKLEKYNFVDDEAFAKWFLAQRENLKNPKGQFVIKGELYKKGVSRELIDSLYFKSGFEDAKTIALKKYPFYLKRDKKTAKNKTLAYIISRGFSFDDAKEAVSIVC